MKSLVTVRSRALANTVPWDLDVLCPEEEDRRGELSTEHSASSHGLPVVVVGGVAYGPADLGDHELLIFGSESDRDSARNAGYTVRS